MDHASHPSAFSVPSYISYLSYLSCVSYLSYCGEGRINHSHAAQPQQKKISDSISIAA